MSTHCLPRCLPRHADGMYSLWDESGRHCPGCDIISEECVGMRGGHGGGGHGGGSHAEEAGSTGVDMEGTTVDMEAITEDTLADTTEGDIIVPIMGVVTTLTDTAASGFQDTGHKSATPGDAELSGFRGTTDSPSIPWLIPSPSFP
jgi:hypothetical protein